MECEAMGRVLTEATVENLKDLWDADRNMVPPEQVRRVTTDQALVDTVCTSLALPARMIKALGLKKSHDKRASSAGGTIQVAVYEAVRLTIQGRSMTIDPMEVPDDIPVLVGQIPLEALDFVIDVQGRRLTGNPAHGGEQMLELYHTEGHP